MTMVLTGRELATKVCGGSSQPLMKKEVARSSAAKDRFRCSMLLPLVFVFLSKFVSVYCSNNGLQYQGV